MTTPYPRLSPDLQRLTGDSLPLWGDAGTRRQALLDILAAWERGDRALLDRAVWRLDNAVVDALRAVRLPRDPNTSVAVGAFNRNWIGRVAPDGRILLDVERSRQLVAAGGHPDRVFHTLVHESIHARGPSSPGRSHESLTWGGYEEGLAEGLARVVTESHAGIAPSGRAYEPYLAAYRVLTEQIGIGPERLWRALWHHRPGDVRVHFADTVALLKAGAPDDLSSAQRSRLTSVGDTVFATGRAEDRPNAAVLARLWKAALR